MTIEEYRREVSQALTVLCNRDANEDYGVDYSLLVSKKLSDEALEFVCSDLSDSDWKETCQQELEIRKVDDILLGDN